MITLDPPRGMDDEAQAWTALGLSRAGLNRFFTAAQAAVGLAGEVDVLLSSDRTVRRLNRDFRGKDKATDVLSFPAAAELAGVHAGDLAVSVETAARQAREQGHALRDEIRVLLLHGLLHLAGMDHEVDDGEMAAREDALRGRLRLKRGLIARVAGEQVVRQEKQIPKGMRATKAKASAETDSQGNDSKKGKSKGKGKSRSSGEGKSSGIAFVGRGRRLVAR